MSRKNWNDDKIINRLVNNKTKRTYWDNIGELRKRASKELFDKSVELTKSDCDKKRIIGIDVLAQLSDKENIKLFLKEVIEIYTELLKKEKVPINLMSILYGIGHNNENLAEEKQIELVTTFKNHFEDFVREGVIFALSGIENEKAIEALILLSEDKRNNIRDWAVFGLSNLDADNEQIWIVS